MLFLGFEPGSFTSMIFIIGNSLTHCTIKAAVFMGTISEYKEHMLPCDLWGKIFIDKM